MTGGISTKFLYSSEARSFAKKKEDNGFFVARFLITVIFPFIRFLPVTYRL